jgi:DNA-binding PadR family transcriptional regulator
MVTRVVSIALDLSRREQLLLLEIGRDGADSASGFVGYMSDVYRFSKSSLWYNLKRMKDKGILDFASREQPGKALALTRHGLRMLERLARSGIKLQEFENAMLPNDADERRGISSDLILGRIALTY